MSKTVRFVTSELGRIIIGVLFFLPAFIMEKLEFIPYLTVALYLISLLVSGTSVFLGAVRGILRRDVFDEKFLMSIASIGAVIIGEWSEGVAVMLFFLIGEYFEHKAVAKSRRSIRALMDIRPDEANVILGDGKEETVDADGVEVGSLIIVRAGERIPLDGIVVKGECDIDMSALTGESIPCSVGVGDEIYSGCVVINGVLTARTVKLAEDSSSARILELVENANERKSKAESFITKFARYYTPIVVISAVLLATVPALLGIIKWSESVYRALTFLVISCPCALVISVPMAFFGGIGGGASRGILFKGGNVFSALAKADSFAFDKTGTLTSGSFSVLRVKAVGADENELLKLSASCEYGSNHPIALSIKESYKDDITEPLEFSEIAGRGTVSLVGENRIGVGNLSLMEMLGADISDIVPEDGEIFVSKNGSIIGSLIISDEIKPEAKEVMSALKSKGARSLHMLTGDKESSAKRISEELSFDEYRAELLPEDKFSCLEEIISKSRHTVYVGDGINDAPSLARADVGIAMGSMGSDSAIESADVVIMSDNLKKLPEAVEVAGKTVRISTENIIFALGIKGAMLVLGALGFTNMWLAVFADVGVAVLAILNSMRALK